MQACFRCWRVVEPQTKWLLPAKSATQRKQLPRRPPHRVGEAGMETSSQQSKSCRELMIEKQIVEWVARLATFSWQFWISFHSTKLNSGWTSCCCTSLYSSGTLSEFSQKPKQHNAGRYRYVYVNNESHWPFLLNLLYTTSRQLSLLKLRSPLSPSSLPQHHFISSPLNSHPDFWLDYYIF